VAKRHYQPFYQSQGQIAHPRYHTVRRSVKKSYLAVMLVSKPATMGKVDLASRKSKFHVAVDEPHQNLFVIKASKNILTVLESIVQLSTAVDMNVASVAALGRKGPVSDKLPNANIVLQQWTRTLRLNTYASRSVDGL